jgi:hypothetical protein
LIDEVAVQSQLADERVDLAKREWSLTFQPEADEAIRVGRDSGVQCRGARIIGEGCAMLARQRRDPEYASDLALAAALVHTFGERADVRADLGAASEQLRGGTRRLRGLVFIGNPVTAALLA